MATTKKAKKGDHPKTESKEERRASAIEESKRRSLPQDAELVVSVQMLGGVAVVQRTVAQVTYSNPTNMAKVLQDMRDELENYF